MNSSSGPSLVLSVLGDHPGDVAERTSVRVEGHDLSIGRAEHCDWVLHAQGVSRQHAIVRHLNGLYFLEDRSTNGMLLNGSPMRGGEPVALNEGDRLQLDTFEILVTIESPAMTTAQTTARRGSEGGLHTLRVSRTEPLPAEPLPVSAPATTATSSLIPGHSGGATTLDPLALFQTVLPSPIESVPNETSAHWNHASPMVDRFDAPRITTADPARHGAAVLPENWDRTRSLFQLPSVSPVAAPPSIDAEPASTEPEILRPEVEARAAATVAPVTPATASTPERASPSPGIEALFTLVLDGVMDVLRARAELKNGFRLPATLIQRRENNPLKFAPTATEALARILAAPNDAFLSGEAAIEDAMDDIRLHQIALLAGVRAAFDDLLAQFDPSRFEEGEARRSRFAFAANKGPWERYRTHFQGLAADPEERFRRLFGDEFARAYEDQLARAKRDGR